MKARLAGEILAKQVQEKACTKSNIRSPNRRNFVMDLNGIKVTPRDQQVLNLLVQGCSNKEIAGQLCISPRTVKQHLRTLFLRAGIRDGRKRVKLAIAAFENQEVMQ
jgi:DNA-binding NarL/FixJ family response regulator